MQKFIKESIIWGGLSALIINLLSKIIAHKVGNELILLNKSYIVFFVLFLVLLVASYYLNESKILHFFSKYLILNFVILLSLHFILLLKLLTGFTVICLYAKSDQLTLILSDLFSNIILVLSICIIYKVVINLKIVFFAKKNFFYVIFCLVILTFFNRYVHVFFS